MEVKRCVNCMEEITEPVCPHCGYREEDVQQTIYGLKRNTILHGKYLIGNVLGQGGFGITYIGFDIALEVKVAIKEYFPMGYVSRDCTRSNQLTWNGTQNGQELWKKGSENFLKEARRMAKIDVLPEIVRVREVFMENQTSYIVMDYVEGETLKAWLLKNGIMGLAECMNMLLPLMYSLSKVHSFGLIHRDISPDNIMVLPNGRVRLLDLGAAKDLDIENNGTSQLVTKKGFSPIEQYMENGKIGTWTDVYALSATIHYCITGKMVPEAVERTIEDTLNFDFPMKEKLSEKAEKTLRQGLAVKAADRIQTVEELIRLLQEAAGTVQKKEDIAPEQNTEPEQNIEPGQDKENAEPEAVCRENTEEVTQVSDDNSAVTEKSANKSGKWKRMGFVIGAVALCITVGVIIGKVSSKKDSDIAVHKINESNISSTVSNDREQESVQSVKANDSTKEKADYGTGEITVWVAESVQTFTQNQIKSFQKANPQYAGYAVTVMSIGEGEAASNMIADIDGGADIYGFAQDQLACLVSSGAIMPLAGDYAAFVNSENDAGAVSAAALGGTIYAFPISSDNGYFMYYDKSVVKNPASLDAVVADCEAAGKNFYMQINSGWYQPAFFFGTGCTLTYDTDDAGNFTACNIDYASGKGVAALKAIINLKKSHAFANGSEARNAVNCGAIVDGTWDADEIKLMFGNNYACAMLPKFTVDGKNYQLSGFGGYKLLGVKPQTDADKEEVCLAIARFLSNEESQLARYDAVSWGPSNRAAQRSSAVKADKALVALAEQLPETIPQGQYPDDYWRLAEEFGDFILDGKYDSASDDELMAALEKFQSECKSLVKQPEKP